MKDGGISFCSLLKEYVNLHIRQNHVCNNYCFFYFCSPNLSSFYSLFWTNPIESKETGNHCPFCLKISLAPEKPK